MSESIVDPNDETIRTVTQTIALLRREMEDNATQGASIAARTALIFRAVVLLLLISAGYLGYLVFVMSQHMTDVNTQLVTMYHQFGEMSGNMRQITASVEHMGANIEGIPVIANDMQRMNGDVAGMLGSVKAMDGNLVDINTDMQQLDGDTAEMAQHFITVNRAVQHIRYNVNQLAAPIGMPPR